MGRFKRGEKIICINTTTDKNDTIVDLSCGREYEVYRDSVVNHKGLEIVIVKDDTHIVFDYCAYRFISMCEYRTEVIDEILN